MVICPDFLSLQPVSASLKNSAIELGAQDCASSNRGALTGEISPFDLRSLGVKYVILGHSERREKLGENEALISAKIKAALANRLTPIVCVGENLAEKEAGKAKSVLVGQLRAALKNVKIKSANDLIIAYEPLWAIGTGQAIIPAEAEIVGNFLTVEAAKILQKRVRVIYGGSVDSQNASQFLRQKHLAGLLVGGASLKEDFYKLCC